VGSSALGNKTRLLPTIERGGASQGVQVKKTYDVVEVDEDYFD